MSEFREIALGELVTIKGGKRLPKGSSLQIEKSDHPYIRVRDMGNRYIDPNVLEYVPNEVFEKIGRYIVQENDVVISIVGTIGLVSVIGKDLHKASQTENCAKLTGLNRTDALYLYYFLSSNLGQQKIYQGAVGAVQAKLPLYSINSLEVLWPTDKERLGIVKLLGDLDDKIELNRKMNQTLEAMAQTLFKSWFVDFDPVLDNAIASSNTIPEALKAKADKRSLVSEDKKLRITNPELAKFFPNRFAYNEELEKWIPEGWEFSSFGDLLEETIGGDWGKEAPDEKHTEEVRIIRGTDIPSIKDCKIDCAPLRYVEAKKLKSRKLEEGDIVIEVSGGSPTQSTGRSLYLSASIIDRLGGVTEPASFCRRFKPKSKALGILCSEHLSYLYNIGKMWEYQNQSTGIANFQTTYFLESEIVLLPNERLILSSFYDQVINWVKKSNSNEIIHLTQLRDTLLPQLISGKLKVPEALLIIEKETV